MSQNKRTGYIAIVGRPNVGKSTLLNHLVGQKISITSRKPQTTRHNILGIKTQNNMQMIFVDTPGLHTGFDKAINRVMNKAAAAATADVDLILFVVDKTFWTKEDQHVLRILENTEVPILVVINKTDQLDDKNTLIPHLQFLAATLPRAEFIPVSALRGQNLDHLEQEICKRLPEAEFLFPEDQVTDRNMRFISAEVIREKLTRQSGSELPYQSAVEIEKYSEDEKLVTIEALILVEREGQKRIVIGEKGARLKAIGTQARQDLEKLLEKKVLLKLWVKVKSGWSDSERALKSLGYFE